MSDMKYTIKDLKGINGYQFMQVMYFLLRSAYYTPETNSQHKRIEDFFKYVGELEGDELEIFLTKIATICGDLSDDYWKIILKNVELNGSPLIPESIPNIPASDLVYIVREGMKKVLAIKLPF